MSVPFDVAKDEVPAKRGAGAYPARCVTDRRLADLALWNMLGGGMNDEKWQLYRQTSRSADARI